MHPPVCAAPRGSPDPAAVRGSPNVTRGRCPDCGASPPNGWLACGRDDDPSQHDRPRPNNQSAGATDIRALVDELAAIALSDDTRGERVLRVQAAAEAYRGAIGLPPEDAA